MINKLSENYKFIISLSLASPAQSENEDDNISGIVVVLVVKESSNSASERECQEKSGAEQLRFIQDIKTLVAGGCEPVVPHHTPHLFHSKRPGSDGLFCNQLSIALGVTLNYM